MPAAARREVPDRAADRSRGNVSRAWRRYELRHRYPNGVRTVFVLLNSDRAALDFAQLVENGLAVEVWDGQRLVEKV